MNYSGSGEGQVMGFYANGKEPSGSVKCGDVLN
jgi:hypothetical protein